MSYQTLRNTLQWLFSILFVVGVLTAALNLTFSGFTPASGS